MYSQIGPRDSSDQKVSHGIGEGDVLLGEGQVPFSLLKRLPFHYLPVRLLSPLRTACRCSAVVPVRVGGGGNGDLDNRTRCTICGGGAVIENKEIASERSHDFRLLGIRVDMVFPKPAMPDPRLSQDGDSVHGSRLPVAQSCAKEGNGGAVGVLAGDAIVLRVYEAEALVRA